MPILLRYYPQYEQAWAGQVDRIQRPPRDLNQWASFVHTTADHYRGRVKVWEVWNEANYTMDPAYYAGLVKLVSILFAYDPPGLSVQACIGLWACSWVIPQLPWGVHPCAPDSISSFIKEHIGYKVKSWL